ncbi:hypothetical protein COY28_00200 [Candidatus Woesearchaeota archaeon CG_4_10_14_0_2_um_filter_57_5]|nr:MAG: hypothetical protein COY28_00200 [Candidatus Woesearchaeota archaeon CG_4_10_14_0_2_um_filter_57_5]
MIGTIWWILGLVCAAWVIIDVLTAQKKMSSGQKALWVILAIVLSILTAIIYYFVVKKK